MSEEEMATIANMMRAMFAEQERKLDARFEAIDRRFEAIDQRFEAIDQRFEAIDQRFEAIDQRFEAIDQRFDSFRVEVGAEIARHLGAFEESLRAQIRALDDKYSDLPGRVAKLENGAPSPKRRATAGKRRRARRRRSRR